MRSLEDITDAVRRNEPATEDELRLAICAYDVLLAQLQLENNPVLLAEFFKAGEADPSTYIGPANDPRNPEAVAWHKAFKTVEEGAKDGRQD